MLHQFGGCHRDHLGSEGDILLQLVDGLGILGVLRQHLELIALTMRDVGFLVAASVFEVEAAADQQLGLLLIRGQVLGQF